LYVSKLKLSQANIAQRNYDSAGEVAEKLVYYSPKPNKMTYEETDCYLQSFNSL
jgi:hypothetical protein